MRTLTDTVTYEAPRARRIAGGWILGAALLAGLAGCGGSQGGVGEEATTTIDTATLSSDDAIADAAAAEHGAPGEHERRRFVLTGAHATHAAVNALRARGFEDVEAAAR